ncbi:hypothetical protein Celaphus_00002077 [Cervus elaphus hippelaphus]|uniref:Uncharacterized protein n=1 Tax=Cervus elaphus hippelaphus TaxID=46360 RepID=A0A212CGZ7_CEREH|nr:hypothetical protein Celaphus_00002077 [Cervus elaphus hippelaphus]
MSEDSGTAAARKTPVTGRAACPARSLCFPDRWDQKEDPIPKFIHFQTPLNGNCALEPDVPSLWDLRAERREMRENAGFWK